MNITDVDFIRFLIFIRLTVSPGGKYLTSLHPLVNRIDCKRSIYIFEYVQKPTSNINNQREIFSTVICRCCKTRSCHSSAICVEQRRARTESIIQLQYSINVLVSNDEQCRSYKNTKTICLSNYVMMIFFVFKHLFDEFQSNLFETYDNQSEIVHSTRMFG